MKKTAVMVTDGAGF